VPRWLSLLLKLLLTCGILGAVVTAVEPSALLATLRTADWTWVAVAALLLPVNLGLEGWVWKQLLAPVLDRVPLRSLAGAVLSGCALGFWTPARLGEYAGRAFYLPEGDRWTLSLTVFAQRLVDMAVGVLVGLAVLGAGFATGLVRATGPWLAAAGIGGGVGGVVLAFVVAPSLAHRLSQRLAPQWTGLTDRTALLSRLSGRQGGAVLVGTLARYAVFTGQMACLGAAFAPSPSGLLLWMAASLTFYVKYLLPSLTALDLGVREGGAAFFFQLLGLGAAAGLNAALLLFALNVLVPALLGAPLVHTLRVSGKGKTANPLRSMLPSSL